MKLFEFVSNMRTKKQLKKMDPKKVPRFSFSGLNTIVRVVDVYDGDTCTVLFKWNKVYIKKSCRLYGIDTPEIRTRNLDEKKHGYEAKKYLEYLVLNEVVYCEFLKDDKYGRPLIKLFTRNNKCVSDILIKHGYAKQYYGGKKEKYSI